LDGIGRRQSSKLFAKIPKQICPVSVDFLSRGSLSILCDIPVPF
jgi:hypothetical protein